MTTNNLLKSAKAAMSHHPSAPCYPEPSSVNAFPPPLLQLLRLKERKDQVLVCLGPRGKIRLIFLTFDDGSCLSNFVAKTTKCECVNVFDVCVSVHIFLNYLYFLCTNIRNIHLSPYCHMCVFVQNVYFPN